MTTLNELKTFKNHPDVQAFTHHMRDIFYTHMTSQRKQALDNFEKYLLDRGYEVKGSGQFGIVFTHPNLTYCIKVFKCDPAYLTFVKIALANPNTHFPKFFGKFIKLDDHYAVRMENLIRPTEKNLHLADALSYYVDWNFKTYDEFLIALQSGTPVYHKLNQQKYLPILETSNQIVDLISAINIINSKKGFF